MQRPGRGQGQGQGQGMRNGQGAGRGSGRCGGGAGMGGTGVCICPKCGERSPHQAGQPCLEERCPSCGTAMVREGSFHHQEIENRRSSVNPVSTPRER